MTIPEYMKETDKIDNSLYADFLDILEDEEVSTYYVGNNAYYNDLNTYEPYSNPTMSAYLQGEFI